MLEQCHNVIVVWTGGFHNRQGIDHISSMKETIKGLLVIIVVDNLSRKHNLNEKILMVYDNNSQVGITNM